MRVTTKCPVQCVEKHPSAPPEHLIANFGENIRRVKTGPEHQRPLRLCVSLFSLLLYRGKTFPRWTSKKESDETRSNETRDIGTMSNTDFTYLARTEIGRS